MSARLLDDRQRRDWLRLIKSENVGPIGFRALINRFGSAHAALEALPDLSARGGLKRRIRLYPADRAERDLETVDRIGARFVALGEPDYPALLRQLEDAPPLLCMKGRAELAQAPGIAIVGARNASALGRKLARRLAADLGARGFAVISGLARGIDTAAHEAALATGTIAVMAGGLDVVYPPENDGLHGEIGETGLLVSEMTPGLQPQARHFPRRNRIISGLGYGTVVVEAAKRSGSLITARMALEQNREVFAVPGSPLDPRAEGTNHLIRRGAMLVTSAGDIDDAVRPMIGTLPPPTEIDMLSELVDDNAYSGHGNRDCDRPDPDLRSRIASLLGPSPVEIDDLIRESGAAVGPIHAILLELELAGRLHRIDARRVSLS